MSSLTDGEKRYFEKLFEMDGGYVLDFKDSNFGEFFQRHNVDIHGHKYRFFGTSKAKKLRAFWKSEPDQLVGAVLSDMLDSYKVYRDLNGKEVDKQALAKAYDIVGRLTGRPVGPRTVNKGTAFLEREFAVPGIHKLPIEAQIAQIVKERLDEAHVVLNAGAHLSVIFLCGSILEAVLLGAANSKPERFNQAKATPRAANKKPKSFHEWNLAQLIDVADEVGVLKPDVKKFSHGLREFRNYIHPYRQLISGFKPDEYTAKICFQALKAALASLAGER